MKFEGQCSDILLWQWDQSLFLFFCSGSGTNPRGRLIQVVQMGVEGGFLIPDQHYTKSELRMKVDHLILCYTASD